MRTVLKNTSEVVHTFAQKTQNEGRAGNVFFEKKNFLYSYGRHYLLAQFITDNDIIINDTGYSVSTSKHIAAVTYATRQYNQYFVIEIDARKVFNRMRELLTKLGKARKPENYLYEIENLYTSFTSFQNYIRKNRINTSFLCAKNSKEYKGIVKIYKNTRPENISTFTEKLKEKAKKEKAKEAKKVKSLLSDFYAYKRHSIRIGNEDFIRVSQNGQNVETSQNVSVPIDDARKLYKAIQSGIDIKGYRIGNYTVNSLNGVLTIGCHRINIESVHRTGNKIA